MSSIVEEVCIDFCFYAIKKTVYQFVVAPNRDALILVVKIIIVMNKTDW